MICVPDGHKLILVEGIPTIFSWENIEQFDGKILKFKTFSSVFLEIAESPEVERIFFFRQILVLTALPSLSVQISLHCDHGARPSAERLLGRRRESSGVQINILTFPQ